MKIATAFVVAAFVIVGIGSVLQLPGSNHSAGSSVSATPQISLNATLDPYNWPPANFTNLNAAPAPPVPDTTPIVVNITQYGEISIPNGHWETVIMNFSGYDAGTAYDYGGNVEINNISVFRSTQPESGSWGVLANLSEFMSIFNGHGSIYFKGPFVPGLHKNFHGIQYNNMSLLFYPIPKGVKAPSYPTLVEPLNTKHHSAQFSLPSNTSAVELQTTMTQKEFWYTLNPAYDGAVVSTSGHRLTTLFSFPWINSGGIDLFSWRPINPVHMLNRQWTYTNLTPALGWLEQTHTLNFTKPSGYSGKEPHIFANLLIWTSPDVKGASQVSYNYENHPLSTYAVNNTSMVNVNGNHYSQIDQSKRISYHYSSEIMTSTGSYTSSVSTFENFNNAQTLGPVWENLSMLWSVKSSVTTLYDEKGMHGVTRQTSLVEVPLAMQLGSTLTLINQKGRDRYYNYQSYFNNATQGLITTTMSSSFLNGHVSSKYAYTSDVIHTNGYFASVLEIGPGFAEILNLTASHHYTQKTFFSYTLEKKGKMEYGNVYYHTMAGIEKNSQSYYVQEKVLYNVVKQYSFARHEGFFSHSRF